VDAGLVVAAMGRVLLEPRLVVGGLDQVAERRLEPGLLVLDGGQLGDE